MQQHIIALGSRSEHMGVKVGRFEYAVFSPSALSEE